MGKITSLVGNRYVLLSDNTKWHAADTASPPPTFQRKVMLESATTGQCESSLLRKLSRTCVARWTTRAEAARPSTASVCDAMATLWVKVLDFFRCVCVCVVSDAQEFAHLLSEIKHLSSAHQHCSSNSMSTLPLFRCRSAALENEAQEYDRDELNSLVSVGPPQQTPVS